MKNQKSEILIYQSKDGTTKIDVKLENETIWLSQYQLAELFQTDRTSIVKHIKNIFETGELNEDSTCAKIAQVQKEGNRKVTRDILYYNLDMIISVGYRVQSHVATHFRIWATKLLKEYVIKGFAMDDERLKEARNYYFDELLARIRDIRSSERVFYRKVCDIYATSIDYQVDDKMTKEFFATVQNKMHYAAHGHTAAEVIYARAGAAKPLMGLMTTRPGKIIRREDVSIAKNYLNETELQTLNRIVNLYIEFAELQALNRKPMTMRNWIEKLDEFLKISGRELLDHAGKISAETAKLKAEMEYDRYRILTDAQPRTVDADFEQAAKQLQKMPKPKKLKPPKP